MIFLVYITFLKCQKIFECKLNHISIFSAVWGTLILGSQILGFVELRIEHVIYWYIVWLIFILSSILPLLINRDQGLFRILIADRRADIILYYTFIILLISYFLATSDLLFSVFLKGFTLENWAEIRKTHSLDEFRDGNWFYTIFGTNIPILVPLMTYLYFRHVLSFYKCAIIFLYFLLVAIAGFTRAPLLALLMVLIVSIRYLTKRKIAPAILALPLALLGLFFGLSSFYLNSLNLDWSFTDDMLVYFFGGMSALTNIMNGVYLDNVIYEANFYSLDFILYPLKTAGIINSYPSLVREYDPIVSTNVYTFLDCFILDFGLIGGLIGTSLIGLILSLIYKSIKYFGLFGVIIYATFLYFTAFVFMNNEFIRFGTVLFIAKVTIVLITYKLFYFRLRSI